MKHQSKQENDHESILTITADEADLAPLRRQVLQEHRGKVKAKGFRPGKAPDEVVEKELGENHVQQDVLERAVNRLYGMAASNDKLKAFDNPEIKIEKFVPYTELSFTAIVPVVPDFKLPDVSKIKVPLKQDKVTAKDVDEVLDRLATQIAEKKSVKRAVKKNDEVTIDFLGKDKDGKEIKGANGEGYPLTIGSKTFIPGFEEKLVGQKLDEEKTFEITFPKDYHAKNMAGMKVSFTVTVKDIKELVKAKIDDEFAKKLGNFDSLETVKKDIEKQLEDEKHNEALRTQREEVIGTIVDKTKFTPPAKLVEQVAESMRREFKQNLEQRGMTEEDYFTQQGQTKEEFEKDEIQPNAAKRAKTSLVLTELAESENIQVSKEDLEKTHNAMKERYKDSPEMLETLDAPEARRDIANQIMTEKTIDQVAEKARNNK